MVSLRLHRSYSFCSLCLRESVNLGVSFCRYLETDFRIKPLTLSPQSKFLAFFFLLVLNRVSIVFLGLKTHLFFCLRWIPKLASQAISLLLFTDSAPPGSAQLRQGKRGPIECLGNVLLSSIFCGFGSFAASFSSLWSWN